MMRMMVRTEVREKARARRFRNMRVLAPGIQEHSYLNDPNIS